MKTNTNTGRGIVEVHDQSQSLTLEQSIHAFLQARAIWRYSRKILDAAYYPRLTELADLKEQMELAAAASTEGLEKVLSQLKMEERQVENAYMKLAVETNRLERNYFDAAQALASQSSTGIQLGLEMIAHAAAEHSFNQSSLKVLEADCEWHSDYHETDDDGRDHLELAVKLAKEQHKVCVEVRQAAITQLIKAKESFNLIDNEHLNRYINLLAVEKALAKIETWLLEQHCYVRACLPEDGELEFAVEQEYREWVSFRNITDRSVDDCYKSFVENCC